MASYPFGLREDPFASGFELSLEETRQLVQNRVSACGGDGAALFPPETCIEIHRRAYGVASAALKLAEHAMLRAAGEGAPSVSPAHVRSDASPSPARAGSPPVPPRPDALPSPARVGSPPAPPRPDVLPSPARAGGPPAPPRPGALPSSARVERPSALPPTSPGRSAVAPARTAPHPLPTMPHPKTTAPNPQALPDLMATRLSPPEPASPDRVHWAASVAVFLLFAIGTAVLILRLNPAAGSAMRSLARTSSPPGATVPADPPGLDDDSAFVVYRAPAPTVPAPAPVRMAAATARAESSLAESPRLGLEVARFIVSERAQSERKRLAASGHKVRVLTGWADGAAVFRVVLGSFSTRSEAERVADELLTSGLIGQARLVTLKPPVSRPR